MVPTQLALVLAHDAHAVFNCGQIIEYAESCLFVVLDPLVTGVEWVVEQGRLVVYLVCDVSFVVGNVAVGVLLVIDGPF